MSQGTFKLQVNRKVPTKQRRYRFLIFRRDVEKEMQICMNICTLDTKRVTQTPGNGKTHHSYMNFYKEAGASC